MRCGHHAHTGFGADATAAFVVQADPNAGRCTCGGRVLQDNLIQGHAHRVRAAAIKSNHAALHRTVVAPSQHRARHSMRTCQKGTNEDQTAKLGSISRAK